MRPVGDGRIFPQPEHVRNLRVADPQLARHCERRELLRLSQQVIPSIHQIEELTIDRNDLLLKPVVLADRVADRPALLQRRTLAVVPLPLQNGGPDSSVGISPSASCHATNGFLIVSWYFRATVSD